jgi:hypothetical protein
MYSVGSFLSGLLGGIIAWATTDFFARPLTRFFALRAGVAEALALYEDRFKGPDAPEHDSEWFAGRRQAYEHWGAGLVAFAASNPLVARLLSRFPLRSFRYHARSAGSNMLGLAETLPGTPASDYFRSNVVTSLKLWYSPWAGKRRRRR